MRRVVSALVAAGCVLAGAAPAAAFTNPQIPGLQVALQARGYYKGPIDGIAGPQTAQAVRRFQRAARLEVDGVVGARTRAALGRLGRPLFGKRDLARGAIGWDVSVLQFLLSWRGHAPPRVNGNFGPGTERAVRRFQRSVGLAPDGIVGPATRSTLLGRTTPSSPTRSGRPHVRYVVRPGDTLTGIATRFGTSVPAIARANRLSPRRFLLIGTRLKVPAPIAGASRSRSAERASIVAAIDTWAAHYNVDPRLARALAWMESGYQPRIVSSVGAWGVMQVTPSTWAFVEAVLIGFPVAKSTEGNVRVGVAYLRHLLRLFGGNERLALAAYYQGPWSLKKRGMLAVSRAFVADVLALKSRM